MSELDIEEIPGTRTIKIVQESGGLVGNKPIRLRVDVESPAYALDFSKDMNCSQKLSDVDTPTILTGEPGGLSFTTGRQGKKAIVQITASEADTYTVQFVVTYAGRPRAAVVTVVAT